MRATYVFDLLRMVDPVVQRDAFFAHPENILLGMAMDKRQHIRELAFRARSQHLKAKPVRIFLVPTVNFNATDNTELRLDFV